MREQNMTTQRNIYYATIVYPESADKDWVEKLEGQHIQALISPLHDKDTDTEGNPKKPHYHVILIFESLKSKKQVLEIIDQFKGVGVIPIQSLGAYSRYLCHLNNPEKAQYAIEDVKELGGANYKECCRQNEAKEKEDEEDLIELTQLIIEKNITYFHEVFNLINKEHKELFSILKKNPYYIHCIVISLSTQKNNKENLAL